MGMLANGADGQTREEILKTIGCEGVSVEAMFHTTGIGGLYSLDILFRFYWKIRVDFFRRGVV